MRKEILRECVICGKEFVSDDADKLCPACGAIEAACSALLWEAKQ